MLSFPLHKNTLCGDVQNHRVLCARDVMKHFFERCFRSKPVNKHRIDYPRNSTGLQRATNALPTFLPRLHPCQGLWFLLPDDEATRSGEPGRGLLIVWGEAPTSAQTVSSAQS